MVLLACDLIQILEIQLMLFKRLTECQAIINEASISLLPSKHPSCSVLLSLSWLLLKMKMSPRKEHAQNVLNKRFWNIWPVRNKDFKGWQLSSSNSHTTAVPSEFSTTVYRLKAGNIIHNTWENSFCWFGVILCFENIHVLIKSVSIKEIYN